MAENPLEEYFRKPAIYIELPSRGNFYEQKPNLSADNELAVYGMTARDELILKNPDALLNGEGILQVFKSIVPDIEDPGEIPTPDYNAILIGMRIASYGKDMDYSVTCSKCQHAETVTFDLYSILGRSELLEPEYIAELENGIKVSIKPSTLNMQNRLGLRTLEQSRLLEVLNDDTDVDAKLKRFSSAFNTLTNITFEVVRDGILYVTLPDERIVKDHYHITEWLNNITKKEYDMINAVIEKINIIGISTEFEHTCTECKDVMTSNLQFDPISFFG